MSDLDQLEDFIKAIARETQWNTGQALIGLQRLRQQMEQQDAENQHLKLMNSIPLRQHSDAAWKGKVKQQEEINALLRESLGAIREAVGLPSHAIVDEICAEIRRLASVGTQGEATAEALGAAPAGGEA